jgi:hypothetical protein
MKYFVLALLFFAAPAFADEQAYVAGIEDLPLMPGLKQSIVPPTEFDKPNGRIVESTASGKVSAAKVQEFYDQTLPQLGWVSVGPYEYVREDEALEIGVRKQGSGAMVRFTIEPRS